MKHPSPNSAGTSAAHWQAAQQGRLALPYCESCRRYHWPARARCPHCRAEPTWRDASGLGRIATFGIVRRAPNPELARAAPYAIAFVDLDEGVRLFTNIVDVQPDALRIGMRVRCKSEMTCDGATAIPVFAPEVDSPSPPAPLPDREGSRAGSP